MPLILPSHAKINLFLEILGQRPDGYHAIRTLMVSISLADTLTFENLDAPRVELECSDPTLPTDSGNLVRRAAELLQSRHAPSRGARIRVEKRIPVGAGLGGGSSNGSATLVGLNRLWNLRLAEQQLETLSAEFGSDTAFFIRGRPALSEGRGEILTPFPFQASLPILLLNFGFGSSTAWAYKNLELGMKHEEFKNQKISSFSEFHSQFPIPNSQFILRNDLERPVFRKFPILALAKEFLASQPPVLGAMMCGSGSTLMAILRDARDGEAVRKSVLRHFGGNVWTWLGETLPTPS